ncbi:Metallo-hydrolase/oxidoreductase superfamily protein [Klebsormidium nitens]|uniref:Metallo-hydrolase/oxidoreductase superfamily protein n=1 Tax=Klebsormidium nitens TaxID=105231 RepID=A0A1Y1HW43_KLENI|nr:Metallo-hydrolase/oxidoreductase superfamily protein [Klebsormidium nitens]|eukprot:GAQ81201.1 Metallo-hydrolase/oxidoreductase superfamily protein [Klebsormidium nitens]
MTSHQDNGDGRQVALLIQSGPASAAAVLVVKQAHDIDSNLWELPTLSLSAAEDETERAVLEEQAQGDPALQQEGAIDALVCAKKMMDELAKKLYPGRVTFQPLKLIVEPDFGPREPMQTAVIKANVEADFDKLDKQSVMMVTQKRAMKWLSEGSDRAFPMIGPLALHILLSNQPVVSSLHPAKLGDIEGAMEYPPGFLLLPLRSSTLPPFKSTTLVAYAPASAYKIEGEAAKIKIEDDDRREGTQGQETEPSEKDTDSTSGRTGEASGSGVKGESGATGQSKAKSKPPLPKGKEKAASRPEIKEEPPAGGTNRGRFDPLRKLPAAAKEKRAQEAEKRRQEKAESLRHAGEKRHEGARIRGTCLLVDPGGKTDLEGRKQMRKVVENLPGPPVVFITHHHIDHVNALSVVERHCPDALVVGHMKTLVRIETVAPALRRHPVAGGDVLAIAGQDILVVSAPGHTDGHLALFHAPSRMLIAGDHCVGHGSAVLDANAGADMQEYFDTTERFQELRPRLLVLMHGRPSFTPRAMLRQYKEHRQKREDKISQVIQGGARTMLDVLRTAYSDTPKYLWSIAAGNVLLHVGRLEKLGKLPEDFHVEKFQEESTSTTTSVRLLCVATGEALGLQGSRGTAVAWTLGIASVVGITAFVVVRWRKSQT